MDEEEFDAFMVLRPFGTEDAMRWDVQVRGDVGLSITLGSALWGKTSDDLQRQLLAPHPDIPPGFGLADFRKLLQWTAQMTSAVLLFQRLRGLSPAVLPSPTVFVGTTRFHTVGGAARSRRNGSQTTVVLFKLISRRASR
jgi:hypothetical protein